MMQRRLACVILLALTACDTPPATPTADNTIEAITPTLPEGYPPQIGTVSATLDGVAQSWSTYDYSIGAFDASVQVLNFNGQTEFRLMGEPPGKPNAEAFRLVMKADMKSASQTGKLANPVIEIIAGKDWDGARLTSIGSDTTLTLSSLTPMTDGYGHVKGQFTTTLCAADKQPPVIDRTKCQPFSGSFDSDLQISGR